eukprot:979994-Prymnesium_polylepis.2
MASRAGPAAQRRILGAPLAARDMPPARRVPLGGPFGRREGGRGGQGGRVAERWKFARCKNESAAPILRLVFTPARRAATIRPHDMLEVERVPSRRTGRGRASHGIAGAL